MKKLKRLFSNYVFNIALIVALSGLVVYLTVRDNPTEVFERLQKADRLWIVLIMAAMLLFRVLNGYALKLEANLSRPEYSLADGIENAFVGGFFNQITPSSSGGQFAQVFLFRRQGVPVSESAGVLWMNFILFQSTMVASVFVLLLLKFSYFYVKFREFLVLVLLGFAVNAAVIVSLWAFVKFPGVYTWLTTKGIEIGAKLHLIKDREKVLNGLDEQLSRFQKEVDQLSSHKPMVAKVCLTHFIRLMLFYSVPYMSAKALHFPVTPAMFLDMLTLASFVAMINAFIPLPGASGGTEATFLVMFRVVLGSVNVRPTMLLWRFMTYYFDMIAGGLVYLISKVRRAAALDQAFAQKERR